MKIAENEYKNLVLTITKYELLLRSIINSARLSYNDKWLDFNDSTISSFLQTFEISLYSDKLERLQYEKAAAWAANENDVQD